MNTLYIAIEHFIMKIMISLICFHNDFDKNILNIYKKRMFTIFEI